MTFVIGLISIILFRAVANPDQVCEVTDNGGACLESTKDAQHSMLQKGFAHASTAHAPKEHHAKHHAKSKDVGDDSHVAGKSGKHAEKIAKESDFNVVGESAPILIVTQEEQTGEKAASAHKKSKVKGKVKATDKMTQKEGKTEAKKREEKKHQDSKVLKVKAKKMPKIFKMAHTASHNKGITKPVKR